MTHREELFRSLAGVLAAHEGVEEAVIYPALRALGDNGVTVSSNLARPKPRLRSRPADR